MTKGAFAYALNYIDERFIAKAIGDNVSSVFSGRKRFDWACLRKPAIAAACFALASVLAIGAFIHFHKGKNDNFGIQVISSEPQINYSVAVTAEKTVYDVNDDIPITIHVGASGVDVEKMEIWSDSENIRLKGDDPLVLTAENGDFEGSWFEFDNSVKYKENKAIEDLPYKMPIALVVNKLEENVLGQIDITVQQSGTGFSQAKTVTLYYSIRGAKIVFSTVSAEDADSCHDEKDKTADPVIRFQTSEPEISYNACLSFEKCICNVNEDIPIVVSIGLDGLEDSIDELKIWSESDNIRLKDHDPLILRAESGDSDSKQFMCDNSVYYIENKPADVLPYKLPVSLVVFKTGDNVLSQIDITVQVSGTGFRKAHTITLYYSIRGDRFAISTVSAEDADSCLG